MPIRYSKSFLSKLEDIVADTDYILRYERGNFKSGYCIIKESKVVVINKYFPLDGRINSLIEILRTIDIDPKKLGEKTLKLYREISQTELQV